MADVLVLDSGGVTSLAENPQREAAAIRSFRRQGLWPVVVPTAVLVECLTGRPDRDARAFRLLKACQVTTELSEQLARRAALLRFLAGRGSAVDAIVVASAEPGGTVLTGDTADLSALAAHAADVTITTI